MIALRGDREQLLYPVGVHDPVVTRREAFDTLWRTPLRLDEGYTAKAMSERKSQYIPEITPENMARMRPGLGDFAARWPVSSGALTCVESANNTLLGMVWILRAGEDPQVSADDLEFVEEASCVVGIALERILLAERVEELRGRRAGAAAFGDDQPREAPVSRRRLTDVLSEREVEVLTLLAEGLTNREIADKLELSVRTVEWHRARLQWKLGVSGRAALVAAAREMDRPHP